MTTIMTTIMTNPICDEGLRYNLDLPIEIQNRFTNVNLLLNFLIIHIVMHTVYAMNICTVHVMDGPNEKYFIAMLVVKTQYHDFMHYNFVYILLVSKIF